MKINCVGNSHSMMFSQSHPSSVFGENPYFKSHRLGSCTAYTFKKHMVQIKDMKLVGPIILAIGEIDIRCHTLKQAEIQGRNPDQILYETIDKYWECVLEINKTNSSICWCPHATANIESTNPSQPVFGPVEERNRLSLLWEAEVKSRCESENIPFVSILQHLIFPDLKTNEDYFMDYCHLNHKAYMLMLKEFKKQCLIP